MDRNDVLELIRQVLYGLDNPQLDASDIDQAVYRLSIAPTESPSS